MNIYETDFVYLTVSLQIKVTNKQEETCNFNLLFSEYIQRRDAYHAY